VTPAPHPRQVRESAFTLTEMIVVVAIVAVLMAAAWAALSSSKASTRSQAMKSAAARVGAAASTYNRMNPPVGGTDRLRGAATWTSTQPEAQGLYSTTGERLLEPWPENPYSGTPLVVQRAASCPASASAGTVVVCRIPGQPPASLRVVAWAKRTDGTPYVVFDQRLR
jgi:prepilin-type N-terminal cleavage/methylation domain-containing protein